MLILEGGKIVKEIERKYDVMSIKYRGISVWSFLRLYLRDSITTKSENTVTVSNISLVLRCLFAYNPLRALKKHSIWSFTGCERRKELNNKMIHRISGAFASEGMDCLMIEKPSKGVGHYKKCVIEEKDIISESWLLMLSNAIEQLLRISTPKLENEHLLHSIIDEYNLDFNYQHYVRKLNAQRLAMRLMLFFNPKPKVVFMESPYDTMGYMWACHETGVQVVEMQHGSLNSNHIAYNAVDYERKMNPDCICVFGETEYKYLTVEKPQFAPLVRMTGMYMLERSNQFFNKDIFEIERQKYKSVVVISGQPNYDSILTEFVDCLAAEQKEMLFIYIPRHQREDLHFANENARIVFGVNIYQYLKWADVHITITSTTGMEAQYFGTPTILYNYKNISATYFKDVLPEGNSVAYVTTPQQFSVAFDKLSNNKGKCVELFANDHVARISEVVNEFIMK